MAKSIWLFLSIVVVHLYGVSAFIREYYLTAEEIEWDYAPTGRNLITDNQMKANMFIKQGPNRIGSKYNKLVYKQYTDATFSTPIAKPAWLGFLGPVLHGEVGDTLLVHFRNRAPFGNYSIHPHGVLYSKKHEGALYRDGSNANADDGVPVNSTYTYVWHITPNFAPTSDDRHCLGWAYHSHVISTKDISSGLLGMLITCQKGILRSDGTRRDVNREYIIYMDMIDENMNWLAKKNLQRCGNPALCQQLMESKDEHFIHSNMLHPINGYLYGHLPNLEAFEGETVAWHFFGLGMGVHAASINGQTMVHLNHRVDTVHFFPASFVSPIMVAVNPGKWLMKCRVTNHNDEGMQAIFTVWSQSDTIQTIGPSFRPAVLNSNGRGLSRFVFRQIRRRRRRRRRRSISRFTETTPKRYFLAIEEEIWDYGPSHQNLFEGGDLKTSMGAMEFFMKGKNRIGGKYKKALYKGYTDANFTTRLPSTPDDVHKGYLGPVIKAEVGNYLEVVVKNSASRPYSFYPHGVSIEKRYEGEVYKTGNGAAQGLIVGPGETVTYKFYVSVHNAPTDSDPQCLTYMYHSAVNPSKDVNGGLIGPLLVCRRKILGDDDKQKNIDKEFHVLYHVVDENDSWYIDENIKLFAPNMDVGKKNKGFRDSNKMHAVNGRMYGNLEGLEMCRGDRTSWHFFAYGDDHDVHSVNFLGNNFHFSAIHKDSKAAFPGSSFTAYMEPDNVGKWALVCRVNHHYHAGMKVLYTVNYCTPGHSPHGLDNYWPNVAPTGRTRDFYIAVEEVVWDYAPDKRDLVTGKNMSSDPTAAGYIHCRSDDMFVGTKYKKAVYREYTDRSFRTRKLRDASEEHLGILGPIIRAEVGDVIRVFFHNKASRSYAIHAQGMLYDKASEGSAYKDFSRLTDDNRVPPGGSHTYVWLVPERSGPSSKEPRCICWMYYSGSNPVKDTTAGLVGPLITCRRRTLDANGKRVDVTRDFALLFSIFNENKSWYTKENFKRYAPGRTDYKDKQFQTSNEMNAMNGFVYGNLPGLVMYEGETIAWYILAVGSATDFHTAHFHGQTFLHRSDVVHRNDVIHVVPGTFEAVEMFTDNPGSWILHCHVVPHMKAGMEAIYTILPKTRPTQERQPVPVIGLMNEHGEPDWRRSRFLPFQGGFNSIPQFEINGRHRFPWFSRIFTRGWTPIQTNVRLRNGRLVPLPRRFRTV